MFHERLMSAINGHKEMLWGRANAYTANYLSYLARAIRNFGTSGTHEAAGFAYWSLFSIFPLTLLSILILSTVFGLRNVETRVDAAIAEFIPGSSSLLIRNSTNVILSHQISYGLISVVSLLFSATRLFTSLQRTLGRVFRDAQLHPWYIQTLRGLAMLIVFALVAMLSIVLSSWFKVLAIGATGRRIVFLGAGGTLALITTNMIMFVLMFRLIPQRKLAWNVLLGISVLGAVIYELSRSGFDWYLVNIANLSSVYGSMSAVIGLLTWLFLLGCIISLMAEIAVATDDWRLSRVPAKAPLTNAEVPPTLRAEPSDSLSRTDSLR